MRTPEQRFLNAEGLGLSLGLGMLPARPRTKAGPRMETVVAARPRLGGSSQPLQTSNGHPDKRPPAVVPTTGPAPPTAIAVDQRIQNSCWLSGPRDMRLERDGKI